MSSNKLSSEPTPHQSQVQPDKSEAQPSKQAATHSAHRKGKIPSNYRILGSSKELHNKPIYCVSWSTDCFKETRRRSTTTCEADNGDVGAEPRNSGVGETEMADKQGKEHSGECISDQSVETSLSYFATCGGNVVTIYEVELPKKGQRKLTEFTVRQGYVDPDEHETFYACAFGGRCLGSAFGYAPLDALPPKSNKKNSPILLSGGGDPRLGQKRPREVDTGMGGGGGHDGMAQEELESGGVRRTGSNPKTNDLYQSLLATEAFDGPQLLCVAGTRCIIKVIDPVRKMLFTTLSGHGDDIYDLKFSPSNEWLLLSASKDESLRLWNVQTATCIAIFAGHEGHRDCILSVGWHPLGDRFASGGMDTTVKLWSIAEGTQVHGAIESSKNVQPTLWDAEVPPESSYRLIYEQMPYFSTTKVHTDYVDCVRFIGDLVLSKDTNDSIVLWYPLLIRSKTGNGNKAAGQQRLPNEVVALREFPMNKCDVWFIRFNIDFDCRMVAVGNTAGEIKLWDIDSNHCTKHRINLAQQHCSSTVRMVAFSPDNHFLVGTCDDSTVWVWESC